jgi:septal ring factor EnvC (AmiA/AmiB activator)
MSAANKLLMSSLLTVLLSVAAVNTALAESTAFHNPEVSNQLKDLKRTASAMRDEADALKSMTVNKRLSWQSHTDRLSTLKKHVNEMGKSLADLENQKAAATEEQVLAIEQTRLHLVPVAENLTLAIELLNERRTNVHLGEYGDAAGDIYAQAEALHTKLDGILDYEDARLRFKRLELQPAFTMGE